MAELLEFELEFTKRALVTWAVDKSVDKEFGSLEFGSLTRGIYRYDYHTPSIRHLNSYARFVVKTTHLVDFTKSFRKTREIEQVAST